MNDNVNIAIVQFPGSNCERETALAVARAGMTPVPFLWNADPALLDTCAGFIIVGGFSYEDRSRAGIIAALDPVMQTIKQQAKAGKPVLGICNGAQILVETGLVPGLAQDAVAMSLTTNKRIQDQQVVGTGYYNTWVHLRVCQTQCAFTCDLTDKDILHMPIAHAEGRFVMPEAVLSQLQQQALIPFRYCSTTGELCSDYPVNPNGSLDNIAAVCNPAGNVMAIMPHPERVASCDGIFRSMKRYIVDKHFQAQPDLSVTLPKVAFQTYEKTGNKTYFVSLMITDNQAETVKTALKRLGIEADVKRFVHWEVSMSADLSNALIQSGELLNTNKECLLETLPAGASINLLVRDKDDMIGQAACQTLKTHFALAELQAIQHGIVWQITSTQVLDKAKIYPILFNPHAHVVYEL